MLLLYNIALRWGAHRLSCRDADKSSIQSRMQETNTHNGSSICTPISSMPSNKADTPTERGMQPQPKAGYRAKGRALLNTNRKREVCLQGEMRNSANLRKEPL
eukprot:1160418-Pelagomonas_calceolata.AAC.8